jgi:peptidoglycan hydrolase-like protein with peptidoglycan-binding domain
LQPDPVRQAQPDHSQTPTVRSNTDYYTLKRSAISIMQERLQAQGHDVGKVDGLIGFATRTAIGQWQARNRHAETCFPDASFIQMIR